jgi:hypothetical protein
MSFKRKEKLIDINDKWKQHEATILQEERAIMGVIGERKVLWVHHM